MLNSTAYRSRKPGNDRAQLLSQDQEQHHDHETKGQMNNGAFNATPRAFNTRQRRGGLSTVPRPSPAAVAAPRRPRPPLVFIVVVVVAVHLFIPVIVIVIIAVVTR